MFAAIRRASSRASNLAADSSPRFILEIGMVLIEEQYVGVDFFADTTAAQIELVGDLVRHIEHHNAARVRRSAA
jgi:hypothetical protein